MNERINNLVIVFIVGSIYVYQIQRESFSRIIFPEIGFIYAFIDKYNE